MLPFAQGSEHCKVSCAAWGELPKSHVHDFVFHGWQVVRPLHVFRAKATSSSDQFIWSHLLWLSSLCGLINLIQPIDSFASQALLVFGDNFLSFPIHRRLFLFIAVHGDQGSGLPCRYQCLHGSQGVFSGERTKSCPVEGDSQTRVQTSQKRSQYQGQRAVIAYLKTATAPRVGWGESPRTGAVEVTPPRCRLAKAAMPLAAFHNNLA